jgi:hypothetical protein
MGGGQLVGRGWPSLATQAIGEITEKYEVWMGRSDEAPSRRYAAYDGG